MSASAAPETVIAQIIETMRHLPRRILGSVESMLSFERPICARHLFCD